MIDVNLHALANAPGYGIADRVLEKAGHPREKPAPRDDDDADGYAVTVEWAVCYSATFDIEASSPSKARRIARGMVLDDPEHGEIVYVEIGKTVADGKAVYG